MVGDADRSCRDYGELGELYGTTLTINETNGQQLTYNNVSGSLMGDAVTVASDNDGGTLVYWTQIPASESWNGGHGGLEYADRLVG